MRKPFQETINYYGVTRKYAAQKMGISTHKMGCYCRLTEPLTLPNVVKLADLDDVLRRAYENGEIQKKWKQNAKK